MYDFAPVVSPIEWNPTLDGAGVFRAEVRLMEPIDIRWPTTQRGQSMVVGVTFSQDGALIATINPPPPADADWHWTPGPGFYEADTFRTAGADTIVIEASIDPRIGEATDRTCIWNGDDLLDCTEFDMVP